MPLYACPFCGDTSGLHTDDCQRPIDAMHDDPLSLTGSRFCEDPNCGCRQPDGIRRPEAP